SDRSVIIGAWDARLVVGVAPVVRHVETAADAGRPLECCQQGPPLQGLGRGPQGRKTSPAGGNTSRSPDVRALHDRSPFHPDPQGSGLESRRDALPPRNGIAGPTVPRPRAGSTDNASTHSSILAWKTGARKPRVHVDSCRQHHDPWCYRNLTYK